MSEGRHREPVLCVQGGGLVVGGECGRGSLWTLGSRSLAGLAAGLSVVPVGAQLDLQDQGAVRRRLVSTRVLQQDGRGCKRRC